MAAATTTTQAQHPPHAAPPFSSASDDTGTRAEEIDYGLDVGMLRELAKRSLIDALNSVNGSKTLVLDPSLAGPLGLVTEVALLKQQGVDKMFWLESGPLNAQTTNIVYLCRPQIKYMKILADQIKGLLKSETKHTFTLVLVPRRTTLCDRVLEEEGVFGEITITSYRLEFIPLENDLLSLEWDSTYREIFLDGDQSSLFYAAQALMTVQKAYGLFPRILGKGDGAKELADLLLHLQAYPSEATKSKSPNLSTSSDVLDSLIIIDRSIDMITPFLTQLTYEGLIDELFGVTNSNVEVDAALLSPPSATPQAAPNAGSSSGLTVVPAVVHKKKKFRLTSVNDALYGSIRDSNFAVVGHKLSKDARRLDSEFRARHQAQTVAQLKDFVGKIGGLQTEQQNLRIHTDLSEQISRFTRMDVFNKALEIQQNLLASYDVNAQISAIEDLVAQQVPPQIVLRLLCTASITGGGIKAKVLENLKKEILQTYGYNLMPLILSLTSLSLLLPSPLPKILPGSQPSKSSSLKPPPVPAPFGPTRKAFRILSDVPEATPTDISYVYSGYAPLSIRLIQAVAMKGSLLSNLSLNPGDGAHSDAKVEKVLSHPISGWKGFEDAIKILPGALVDEVQRGSSPTQGPVDKSDRSSTTFVFFLGGCTYTEVSAIRWMARNSRGRKFLVGTTGIISGTSLLQSMAPPDFKFQCLSSLSL